MSDERTISEDEVRKEHLEAVNVPAHWAYLLGVIGGGLVLMVLLLLLLGASA